MPFDPIALVLVVTAGSVPAAAAENPRPPANAPILVPPPKTPTPAEMTQALRADAARRSGLAAERLVTHPPEAVTWPDGAIGCPRPGLAYTQALVPGWRVRIEAGDQVLHYHASRSGYWVYCPAERAVAPLPADATR